MESTEQILALREGSLATVPFPRLLHALAGSGRTVVVELTHHSIVKRMIVEYGVPVDCRSNLVQDTLSRFLVQLGRLSREEESRLLAEAAARGWLFGEVIREEGLVSASELFKLLQQNLAKKLLDLFTWEEGDFRFEFDVPRVESPLKVRVPQLILTGCARFVPRSALEIGVGYLVGRTFGVHPEPAFDLESLHLSRAQRQVLSALAVPQSLTELTQGTQGSFEEITRFVYALSTMDLLIGAEELAEIQAALPVAEVDEPEVVATPAPPPPPVEDPGEVANEVMSAYLHHRRVDAFGLLAVDESATDERVRRQFLAYCRKFAPWRFEATQLAHLADKAEELFLTGVVAYHEIATAAQRRALVKRREAAQLKITRRAADEHLEPDLVDPEEHFQRGRSLMETGVYSKALSELELAAKCDPQNALYRAEAAYCWYLASPGTGAKHGVGLLEEALRVDPECELAIYYLGDLHRVLGNWTEAETHLRRSIKLLAPDRRPIDALREMVRAKRAAEAAATDPQV